MKYLFYIVLLTIFTASCSEDKPSTEKIVRIYSDILLVRSQYSDTSVANSKIDSIIRSNEMSKTEFKETLVYMFEHNKDFILKIDSLRNNITPVVKPIKTDTTINE